MKVSEFMTSNVISCHQDQTVEEAATLMAKEGISVLPIVDNDDKLVGLITESDFVSRLKSVPHALVSLKQLFGKSFHSTDVETIYKESKGLKLSNVMTKNLTTVNKDQTLDNVVEIMSKKGLKRLPVIDGDKLVGIVTRKNLIQAFNKLN